MIKLISIIVALTAILKKNSVIYWKFNKYIKQCYSIVWSVEKADGKNSRVSKKNKGKVMMCKNKKLKFINEQKTSGLLRSSGIKVNRFLLGGDKFMHEMLLKQSGFTFKIWPFCWKQRKNTKF